MATSLEALEAEVLQLSAQDRSRLLERLIVSLDADEQVEALSDAVADQRATELESGATPPVPFEESIAKLEARLPNAPIV